MFAPNNPVTAARAEVFCEEAIYKFEPRVEKVSCFAVANRDEPNRLDIRIEYVIAGKNDKRNLVFPFYLKTEEEEPASQNGVNGTSGANGFENA
jgi:predicted component of type VI protein secretion system